MKIVIGSDEKTHLTDTVITQVEQRGHTVELVGTVHDKNIAWPQVAEEVAMRIAQGHADEGILFCWTGTGVTIAANKVTGIRAALCHDAETAKGARLWNRANVLCLNLRATSEVIVNEILDAWFNTPLGDASDDVAAVEYLTQIEKKYK